MSYRLPFMMRPVTACIAMTAVGFSLAGCGGGGSSSVSSPSSISVSNASLRTASLVTVHGFYALAGGLELYSDVPDTDLASMLKPKQTSLLPLPGLKSKAASANITNLNFSTPLNLYYSSARSGQNFNFSFFSDAAGAHPAGSAPLTLPASFAVHPNTTGVNFNLTGGNFPGTGAATIVRSTADDYTINGTLHLNSDKFDAQYNIGEAASNGTSSFFGTFLVNLGNNQNIRINNITETNDANGDVQLGATVTLNPNQAGAYTGPLATTDTGITLKLTSGTNVLNATIVVADANGDLLPHPTLHLIYPDGTTEDIADALAKPAQ